MNNYRVLSKGTKISYQRNESTSSISLIFPERIKCYRTAYIEKDGIRKFMMVVDWNINYYRDINNPNVNYIFEEEYTVYDEDEEEYWTESYIHPPYYLEAITYKEWMDNDEAEGDGTKMELCFTSEAPK